MAETEVVCPDCGTRFAQDTADRDPMRCPHCTRAYRTWTGADAPTRRLPAARRVSATPAPAAPAAPAASAWNHKPAAAAPAAPADPFAGLRIGGYVLERRLGHGAYGSVYRARDVELDRPVAVKLLGGGEDTHIGPAEIERFRREAQATARIDHPNVVAVYKVGRDEDLIYIAMQLVEGGSALNWLTHNADRSAVEATRIIRLAARGLAAAHAAGVLHRDVKPANILLGTGGEVKVADFGLAKFLDETAAALTETGTVVGTPHYMSPEQCRALPLDHLSDVYSLGVSYFHLLTGRTPFTGRNPAAVVRRQVQDVHPDPRTLNPAIPIECVEVVDRAMQKVPQNRYRSADEMADALERVESLLRNRPAASGPVGGAGPSSDSLPVVILPPPADLLTPASGEEAASASAETRPVPPVGMPSPEA